jgi:hypothetical protein
MKLKKNEDGVASNGITFIPSSKESTLKGVLDIGYSLRYRNSRSIRTDKNLCIINIHHRVTLYRNIFVCECDEVKKLRTFLTTKCQKIVHIMNAEILETDCFMHHTVA